MSAVSLVKKFERQDITALVVDDDSTTRRLLRLMLNSMGAASVVEAPDGVAALQIIFGDQPPNLIICDLNMKPMDGMSLVAAINASLTQRICKIPVIVFSATEDREMMLRARQVGAIGSIPKPFTPKGLSEYLSQIVTSYPPPRFAPLEPEL